MTLGGARVNGCENEKAAKRRPELMEMLNVEPQFQYTNTVNG